jgi:heptosyltransferase-2/heptosyltransferase-3
MSSRLEKGHVGRSPIHKEISAHNHGWQKILFDGTSRLTGRFPRAGSRVLDLSFRSLVGNSFLRALCARHNRRIIRSIRSFRRFLVIPDIHIGDAVMTQSALSALRDFFPHAHVDYVINRAAYPLIEGNPEATRVLPFFVGGSFPSGTNLQTLRDLIKGEGYDLCLNFCPYIRDKQIAPDGAAILNILSYAPVIVKNERDPSRINHFIYHNYRFIHDLLSIVAEPVRAEPFRGVRLTFADSAVDMALRFASDAGLSSDVPVVLFNPDGASPYTRLPFETQADLLDRLARMKALILLGWGHTAAGIGARLKDSLPLLLRSKVRMIPADLPLEVYSALIDFCDVFVSGDTGPLHLAAARRYSRMGRFVFRNRTAVLSLFGATPARMSGYDSFQRGYLPANQDAPSWAYTAESPCRNISCLNKMYKTCRTIRCFEKVDIEGLARRVGSYLEGLPGRAPLRREPVSA